MNILARTKEKIKKIEVKPIKLEPIEEQDRVAEEIDEVTQEVVSIGKVTKKVVGIVSYLPANNYQARQQRLLRLLGQLKAYWPSIPIIIIAQNWRDNNFLPKDLNIKVFNYKGGLGILKARQTLREKFLETDYEQIIMFDDDAVISTNPAAAQRFLEECDKHPNGFMFLKGWRKDPLGIYNPAQLNGCVISRWLYAAEPIRDQWNPQEKGVYEDVIYSHLFHWKYPEYEFEVPDFQCIQWSNQQYKVASTWKTTQRDCVSRTRRLMEEVKKECLSWRQQHNKA